MSSVSSLVTLNESILTEPQCSDLQHREGYPFPGLPQSICSTRQCAHLSGLPPGSHAKTRVGVRQRSSSDVWQHNYALRILVSCRLSECSLFPCGASKGEEAGKPGLTWLRRKGNQMCTVGICPLRGHSVSCSSIRISPYHVLWGPSYSSPYSPQTPSSTTLPSLPHTSILVVFWTHQVPSPRAFALAVSLIWTVFLDLCRIRFLALFRLQL